MSVNSIFLKIITELIIGYEINIKFASQINYLIP